MKKIKFTRKQIREICELIDIAVGHLGDKNNERNSVHFSIGYYGATIKALTELIANGYPSCYEYESILRRYEDLKDLELSTGDRYEKNKI